MQNAPAVNSPKIICSRIALNVATDRRRRKAPAEYGCDRRLARHPGRVARRGGDVEGRQDIQALDLAVCRVAEPSPPGVHGCRCRKMPDHEIAAQLGVRRPTVEIDLRNSLKHCAARLGRTLLDDPVAHVPNNAVLLPFPAFDHRAVVAGPRIPLIIVIFACRIALPQPSHTSEGNFSRPHSRIRSSATTMTHIIIPAQASAFGGDS